MTEKIIKYHPGFVGGLEILFWAYRDKMEIGAEKWLSTEGIRMDVLILKKDDAFSIDHDIGRIFRGNNIVEYKSPDDELSIDDFSKALSYAYLYKSLGKTVDAVSFNDMTVTMYRHAFPRELFRKLEQHGAVLEEKYRSIYYVHGIAPFPIQIVVGKNLYPGVYSMLRVLTPDASNEDIINFSKVVNANKDATYRRFIDNIYQVSVSANRDKYETLKEVPIVCEALRDLMKSEIKEELNVAEITGAVKAYNAVGISPKDIISRIMGQFSISVETARDYVTSVLGTQTV